MAGHEFQVMDCLMFQNQKVTQWPTEWQGHLLSCSGQLKKHNLKTNQFYLWIAKKNVHNAKYGIDGTVQPSPACGIWKEANRGGSYISHMKLDF